jgi:uncharacterized protein with gpF-like domain
MDWNPRRRIEIDFRNALLRIINQVTEYLSIADPQEVIRILNHLPTSDQYRSYADKTASRMVTSLVVDGRRTWREAAHQSAKGRLISDYINREIKGYTGVEIRAQVMRNAQIIKTMGHDISREVSRYIEEEMLKGRRASEIMLELKKIIPLGTQVRRGDRILVPNVKLIARTEVSKTSTALTRSRSEELGFAWYRWVTEKDERVRDSHQIMDDVLCRWSDPPSPEKLHGDKWVYGHYHAGNIFNCRCYPEPVTNVNLISWPHKVYINGAIRMMTRTEFERMAA